MRLRFEVLDKARTFAIPLVAMTIFAFVVACALPKYAYPPPLYHHGDRYQLRSAMGGFAKNLHRIDRLLRPMTNAAKLADNRSQVVALLKEMEAAAAKLDDADKGNVTPEPLLKSFQDQLRDARVAAESSPPNYYLAGRLAGVCLNCHSTPRL